MIFTASDSWEDKDYSRQISARSGSGSPSSRIITFSLLLALVVLMATGSGRGRGRGKKNASKRSRDEGSTSSESEPSSEYEGESVKGKGKAPRTSRKKKGADSPPRRSTGGPVIRECSQSERRSKLGEGEQHISSKRRALFENRACIGERHINFSDLYREVPDFAMLLERIPIEPLGRVPARMGFCVELFREFYMRAVILHEDPDTGTFIFETTVRGVKFDITPVVIGANLGLIVDTTGMHYTHGEFQYETHWDIVVNEICKSGTHTNRLYVESKDLKPEYHILSLIVYYNLLPTLGTKRIRWDRLLFLYFLGHPESAYGVNVNIPFLIWQQMMHVIEGSNRRELLPYPILITSILEDHGVDIKCVKYDYGLGAIDGITLAKSISTLKTFGQVKGYASEATPSAPPRQVEHQDSSGSDEVVTLQSLHRDVRSLKKRMKQGFKKLEDGLKKIFYILGCKHDDVVPGATGPSTSHGPTSHDDDDSGHDDD